MDGQLVPRQHQCTVGEGTDADIVAEIVVTGRGVDHNVTVVLQGRADAVEDPVKCARGVHEAKAPLIVPAVGDAGLRGRAALFRGVAQNVTNFQRLEGIIGLQEHRHDARNHRRRHAGAVFVLVVVVGQRALGLARQRRTGCR